MSYLAANQSYYAKSFQSGYGVQYPEGHVIRVYERILKYELHLDGSRGEKLLDFGCGTGTHCLYFRSKGFDVYGVDADPTAIAQCRERMPEIASHFETIDAQPSPQARYGAGPGVYAVILTNQVLYYLSRSDFEQCLVRLNDYLRPGGVLIATMMGTQHWYFRHSKEARDGLREITLTGRAASTSYIQFIGSREELIQRFQRFQPLHVGYYDFQIRDDEGSGLHYLFVGQKR